MSPSRLFICSSAVSTTGLPFSSMVTGSPFAVSRNSTLWKRLATSAALAPIFAASVAPSWPAMITIRSLYLASALAVFGVRPASAASAMSRRVLSTMELTEESLVAHRRREDGRHLAGAARLQTAGGFSMRDLLIPRTGGGVGVLLEAVERHLFCGDLL